MRHVNSRWLLVVAPLAVVGVAVTNGCGDDDDEPQAAPLDDADLVRGGQLYDKWWEVTGVLDAVEPTTTNPGYRLTSGTRAGSDTWRCKECHGWDYRGRDGAYGQGSPRFTGVSGLLHASEQDPPQELFEVVKDGLPGTGMSSFRSHLSDRDIRDIVRFIKEGIIDETRHIDYASKKPLGADVARGQARYTSVCAACHGSDGKLLNFGTEQDREYVGTVAIDNPWEFLHKVRFGQPGTAMPSAVRSRWSVQDILDVLGYAQTLPAE